MKFAFEIREVREIEGRGCVVFPGFPEWQKLEVGLELAIEKPSGEKFRTRIASFERGIQKLLGLTHYVPFSVPDDLHSSDLPIGSRVFIPADEDMAFKNPYGDSPTPPLLDLREATALLPAFFIGSIGENITLATDSLWTQKLPAVVSIVHTYDGTGVSCAKGVGFLIPLGTSPRNGPLVDILRLVTGNGVEAEDVEARYPHLKGIGEGPHAFALRHLSCGWGPYSDSEISAIQNLFAMFISLPPIGKGSQEALVSFEGSLESLVLGWGAHTAALGVLWWIDSNAFEHLRKALAPRPVKSYLLWENSD